MKSVDTNSNINIYTPVSFLQEMFLEKKQRNPAYSTRAFARDLGMSQALLSLILSGKRPLTAKQAMRVSALLGLSAEQSQELLAATLAALPITSKDYKKLQSLPLLKRKAIFKNYEVERFKAISQWYHIAILDLTTTKGFRNDPEWIANRLGISIIQVRDALTRLMDLGFIEEKNGLLKKIDSKIYFVTQNSESAIRTFHKSMLAKAEQKLDEIAPSDFERREISSMTIAVNRNRIAEAKKKIQDFQKELATFLGEGECDEVFQFNTQFFSLTKWEKK